MATTIGCWSWWGPARSTIPQAGLEYASKLREKAVELGEDSSW